MADEFVKGFAILTVGLLVWMMFASWFNTPSFYEAQLIGPGPEDPTTYEAIALIVKDAMLAFAIFGALTFWVVIPASRRAREYYATN
ncbi:DUF7314 family protein [Natronoglomus mannanivorans]|uniref:DUF7314 domain-containing protein n=1 Tax=Natronoglomus mannanivorans TaxID=2979990 RepID=A0AAP2YYR6_9EURY|nr:hypothetical protein [Halobacteria archaeon AArc-xg1-1]